MPGSSTLKLSPEEITPFPQAPPRKNRGGRKRGKILILTDTPVKEGLSQTERYKFTNKNKTNQNCKKQLQLKIAVKKACKKIPCVCKTN